MKVKDGIQKVLHIVSLREVDSGDYECILTNQDDKRDVRRSKQRFEVSSTRGQLKFITASQNITTTEGETIRLYHIAKAFPTDEYVFEWRKVPIKAYCDLLSAAHVVPVAVLLFSRQWFCTSKQKCI